jgi:Protein kinase domain
LFIYYKGNGAVLGAVRRSDNVKVAIKIIYKRPECADTEEMDILRSLSSSFIVSYIDNFEDELITYLVMENFGSSWRRDTPGKPDSV